MNSSISSSDPDRAARQVADWTGFTKSFLAASVIAVAAVLALAWLVDPYDTGRSPLDLREGVRPQGPRTAAASRGRDPSFQGAIFGNSHIQLISPEQLKEQTGIPFVSLIAPATGPKEGLTLIDWFLRHQREPAKAVVVGIDAPWCTADPEMPNEKPFPFWLFTSDTADYLVGLLRFEVVEEMQRRIAYLITGRDRARPDGYWDYEPDYVALGYTQDAGKRADLETRRESGGGNATGPYPAADALEALLDTSPQTALILVRPPVYHTGLPVPGSADAAADAGCRAAFARIAERRPKTALVDWRTERPELSDPNQFFDASHYRQPLARKVEADIAAALTRLR